MINNKIKYFTTIFLAIVSMTFTSCDKVEDPNIGGTSTEDMAGDWYVQMYNQGDEPSGDYALISTHNTAADNGEEMWIDDHKHLWYFKSKTPINLSAMTFSGADLASSVDDDDDPATPSYDITVTITNGMITQDDTLTSGGNTSNGISFDIEFSDDAGSIYTVKGYKRTGFAEDEH
jgi:hypothetical protein